jgi:tungstate transport system substrate-binding protein
MGATLNIAVGKHAYALTDCGTWLSFANKGDFEVLVEGDPAMFNQYGLILVVKKHPRMKAKKGKAFVDRLISDDGQKAIASYKIDGQQLLFPNAARGT